MILKRLVKFVIKSLDFSKKECYNKTTVNSKNEKKGDYNHENKQICRYKNREKP
jgi:hypothetical protein